MAITLTPAAHARVAQFVARQDWGYVTELVTQAGSDDTVFEQDGVRVYVDASSLPLVDGTAIDFARQGLGEVFVFDNPNAKAECGCGESFTTDADKA